MAEENLDIVVRLRNLAGRQLANLNKGFGLLGKTVSGLGRVFGSFQAQLAGLLTGAALVGFSKNVVDVFADFDDTLRAAAAVMGATTEQFDRLGEAAEDMGRKTKFSASQSADALRLLGMAGLSVDESIAALPGVLNLAAAGGLELADAADIATNVVAGFNLEVQDLESVNNVLAKTFTSSNSTLQELGEGFKLVGPIAAGVGADFEDLVGALGKLHDAGLKGTIAGTSLRGAMSALLNPTNDEKKLMEELGQRIGQTTIHVRDANGQFLGFAEITRQLEEAGLDGAEALKLFGDRAGPGMQALLSVGSRNLRDYIKTLKNAGGTTDEIAQRMEAGVGGAGRRMAAAFEGVKIALGKAFEDVIIREIEKTTQYFNDLINVIIRLDADGTLVTWAETAIESLEFVGKAVGKVVDLFVYLGKTISVVALAMTGNIEAARLALEDSFDSLDKLLGIVRDKSEKTVFYKINQETGELEESTVKTANEVKKLREEYSQLSQVGQAQVAKLAAAEAKLSGAGAIGRGKAEGQVPTQTAEVKLEPKAGAVLAADVSKLQAVVQKELTALDILYDNGLVKVQQYFDERKSLLEEAAEAEIDLLQKQADVESDPTKRLAIETKVFAQKQALQEELLQLSHDRLREETRLEQEAANNKLEITRVFEGIKARLAASEGGGFEAQFQKEVDDLNVRHQRELELLQTHNAAKAELNDLARKQELEKMKLHEDQERRLLMLRLDSAQQVAGGVSQIFDQMYKITGEKQKEFFYLSKAASIAQATINIAEGVTKAWSQGGMYGAIGAALVAAAGAAQIATIVSQSFATGGQVQGSSPSPTSDNIIARVTAGEYIHPVDAVRYYGANVMEAIRNKSIPRELLSGFGIPSPRVPKRGFATGGQVPPGMGEGGGGAEQQPININNFIDPSMMSQHMQTSTGQRDVWNVLSQNPHKLKQMVFAQ